MTVGWLVGWLAGRLAGWWLVGSCWLVGCLFWMFILGAYVGAYFGCLLWMLILLLMLGAYLGCLLWCLFWCSKCLF